MDKLSKIALAERGFCKLRVVSTDTAVRSEVRKEVRKRQRLEEKRLEKQGQQLSLFDEYEDSFNPILPESFPNH